MIHETFDSRKDMDVAFLSFVQESGYSKAPDSLHEFSNTYIRRTEMWFNNLIVFMLGCASSSRRLDAAHDDGIADMPAVMHLVKFSAL